METTPEPNGITKLRFQTFHRLTHQDQIGLCFGHSLPRCIQLLGLLGQHLLNCSPPFEQCRLLRRRQFRPVHQFAPYCSPFIAPISDSNCVPRSTSSRGQVREEAAVQFRFFLDLGFLDRLQHDDLRCFDRLVARLEFVDKVRYRRCDWLGSGF